MNTTAAASAPSAHLASNAAAARRAAVLDGSASGIVMQRRPALALDFGVGAMLLQDPLSFAQRRVRDRKMAQVRQWRDNLCKTEIAKGSAAFEIAKRLEQFNASLSDAYRTFA